jgi:hypothetical protein
MNTPVEMSERKHFPKQLVDVLGTGSLLQMTVR